MQRKSKRHDKRLTVARRMPPLYRTRPGEEYSVQNDGVLDWVKAHTDLGLYVIDLLARLGYILYDPESGTWRGVDYDS